MDSEIPTWRGEGNCDVDLQFGGVPACGGGPS